MKKNELSPEDFSALANAVADLPFVKPNRAPADYMLDLMETVINFHVRVEVVVSSGNAQFYVDPVHNKFVKMASTDAPKQFWHVDGITKVVAKGDGGAATIRVYPISKG